MNGPGISQGDRAARKFASAWEATRRHVSDWNVGRGGRICLVLAVASMCLPGCGRKVETHPGGKQPAAVPVTVVAVTNAFWEQTVSIVGTLYPKDTATVSAQVEGGVEQTLVDFGDRVTSGQGLARIDTASYEAELVQASGNLARAEATLVDARQIFERVQRLSKENIASPADFDAATAAVARADAEVSAAQGGEGVARLNLARSHVTAPFEGGIAQRLVGRGDYVKGGSPLFVLVNDAVLKFIFQVPERYGSMVKKGLPVSFGVDNYPGESFLGSVYLISPSVNTASRAFNVGALVTNTAFRLKANTFARGSLVLVEGAPTPVVPLDSVVSFAGVTKVFVVTQETARARAVRVGRVREGLQEVLEGIHAGDQVVVTGNRKLTDGSAVKVDSAAPGAGTGSASGSASGPEVAAREARDHGKP